MTCHNYVFDEQLTTRIRRIQVLFRKLLLIRLGQEKTSFSRGNKRSMKVDLIFIDGGKNSSFYKFNLVRSFLHQLMRTFIKSYTIRTFHTQCFRLQQKWVEYPLNERSCDSLAILSEVMSLRMQYNRYAYWTEETGSTTTY